MAVGTLSALRAVLPAFITALRASSAVIRGKSMWRVVAVSVSGGMSPASALLVSNSATSSSFFSSIDFAGGLSGCDGSLSGGLR
jgi:hypothetical protein